MAGAGYAGAGEHATKPAAVTIGTATEHLYLLQLPCDSTGLCQAGSSTVPPYSSTYHSTPCPVRYTIRFSNVWAGLSNFAGNAAMSLTFDFPGFHKQWDEQQGDSSSSDRPNKDGNRIQNVSIDASWQDDLQELSGEAEDEQHEDAAADQQLPHQQAHMSAGDMLYPSAIVADDEHPTGIFDISRKQRTGVSASPRSSAAEAVAQDHRNRHHHQQQQQVPDAVLLLIVDLLHMRDVMAVACCCKAWHECLLQNNQDIWVQQEQQLLGGCDICSSVSLSFLLAAAVMSTT